MEINIFQVIFQIINFSILLFLLKKFLYKPILNILEQRSKKIHEGLDAAEKSIEEREKIEKERRKIMLEAEKNANRILEGARLSAKKLEKQILEKAESETEKRIKKSEELAESKLTEMEEQLQARFYQSVIDTTEKLLKESLSQKEQRMVIQNQIKQLKKVNFTT